MPNSIRILSDRCGTC